MKSRILAAAVPALLSLCLSSPALALDGEPYIHDPSTIVECDGKYYTFGTGGGGLMSDDGWTWHSGASVPGGGAAPDVIHIGDRYFVAFGATGGGLGGGHAGTILHDVEQDTRPPFARLRILTMTIVVASTDGVEDCDAIDPSFLLDPTDGRLWLTYGTFFGFIRMVELDPKTGKRVAGNEPMNIAIDCEATDLIYRDGWYYLLGTHGTCCDGANSTYNIVVGRSRNVTGPYLDNMGIDMLRGGGKLVVAANGRFVGPGHFGLLNLGDGVQKFSCHYEADLDRSGRSVLDIRPLLWKDGWPVAGDNFKEGTYEIQSERSGYALELAVDFVRMSGRGGFGGFGRRGGGGPATPIPGQDSGRSVHELAGRQHRRSPRRLHAPAPPEVDDHARRRRRRLSRLALFQDHHRRHGSRAGRDRRRRGGDGSRLYRRARTTLAHRPVDRWHLPHHAQGCARFHGTHGPDRDRRQHADPGQVRPQQRQGAGTSERRKHGLALGRSPDIANRCGARPCRTASASRAL